jgi:hypothetical protein
MLIPVLKIRHTINNVDFIGFHHDRYLNGRDVKERRTNPIGIR